MKLPLLLAALCLAACGVPSVANAGCAPFGEPPPEIEYRIELRTEPALEVAFEVSAPSADDGATVFEVDRSWGGVDEAAELVLDVRVVDSRGSSLAVEHPRRHQWLV